MNRVGRPRKFTEKELIEIVNMYIQKNNNNPHTLKLTKLAQYANEHGIIVSYQDFSRNIKVKKYIDEYNKMYKKMVIQGGNIKLEDNIPIYESIDVNKIIENNSNIEDIRKSILLLNSSNEKLVEQYDKINQKLILQVEKNFQQKKEIEDLNKKISKMKEEHEKDIFKLKEELKNSKEKKMIMTRKMNIYNKFIELYHYDKISEYALYLDNLITKTNYKEEEIINKLEFYSKEGTLKDIVNKYDEIFKDIENSTEEYIEEIDENNTKANKNKDNELEELISMEELEKNINSLFD